MRSQSLRSRKTAYSFQTSGLPLAVWCGHWPITALTALATRKGSTTTFSVRFQGLQPAVHRAPVHVERLRVVLVPVDAGHGSGLLETTVEDGLARRR